VVTGTHIILLDLVRKSKGKKLQKVIAFNPHTDDFLTITMLILHV